MQDSIKIDDFYTPPNSMYTAVNLEVPKLNDLILKELREGAKKGLHNFIKEYPVTFMTNENTPHSERKESCVRSGPLTGSYTVPVRGNGISGTAHINDETIEVKIPVPGIEPELVVIRRVNNIVRVIVTDDNGKAELEIYSNDLKNYLEYVLAENEVITDVEIDLGMLTICIDRGADVEEYRA